MKNKVNILIVAGFILLVLFGIYSYKKYTRNIIDEMIARNNLINILIAGRNVYNDNTFNFYAIVSINPGNNNIGSQQHPIVNQRWNICHQLIQYSCHH